MLAKTLQLALPAILIIIGCNQSQELNEATEDAQIEETVSTKYDEPHQYGGWFCPDNLGGFPPMDVQDIYELQVISDRLPTKEETYDGTSLIYIDTEKHLDARPLDIILPKVGRIYSRHNQMNELVIVIQALVISNDTVVGYRFPSGGNGSAWYGEIDFLSNQELEELGSIPFVYHQTEMNSTKQKVWKAFTSTDYAKELSKKFGAQAFFESDWTSESYFPIDYQGVGERASGMISDLFGNLYMHIDYDINGFHYTEKVLVSEDPENNTVALHFVSGPHTNHLTDQESHWQKWMDEVKEKSES